MSYNNLTLAIANVLFFKSNAAFSVSKAVTSVPVVDALYTAMAAFAPAIFAFSASIVFCATAI